MLWDCRSGRPASESLTWLVSKNLRSDLELLLTDCCLPPSLTGPDFRLPQIVLRLDLDLSWVTLDLDLSWRTLDFDLSSRVNWRLWLLLNYSRLPLMETSLRLVVNHSRLDRRLPLTWTRLRWTETWLGLKIVSGCSWSFLEVSDGSTTRPERMWLSTSPTLGSIYVSFHSSHHHNTIQRNFNLFYNVNSCLSARSFLARLLFYTLHRFENEEENISVPSTTSCRTTSWQCEDDVGACPPALMSLWGNQQNRNLKQSQ